MEKWIFRWNIGLCSLNIRYYWIFNRPTLNSIRVHLGCILVYFFRFQFMVHLKFKIAIAMSKGSAKNNINQLLAVFATVKLILLIQPPTIIIFVNIRNYVGNIYMYVPVEARPKTNMKFNGLNETVCMYVMIRATISKASFNIIMRTLNSFTKFVYNSFLLVYNVQLEFNLCQELRILELEISLIFVSVPNSNHRMMIGYL